MISVSSEGSDVILDVTIARTGDSFRFRFGTASPTWARLLSASINDTREQTLRRLREQAYAEGYRDGRAKRVKQGFFSGGWW